MDILFVTFGALEVFAAVFMGVLLIGAVIGLCGVATAYLQYIRKDIH